MCLQLVKLVLWGCWSVEPDHHLWSCSPAYKQRMIRSTTKPIKWPVRPGKTQISQLANQSQPAGWPEPSLCAQCVAKNPRIVHADSKDPDQTGQTPRPIQVFAGRKSHFFGFILLWLKCLNLFMASELFHPYWLDKPVCHFFWCTFSFLVLLEISECKQCRPWSNATFCSVWFGSTLFAKVPIMGPY